MAIEDLGVASTPAREAARAIAEDHLGTDRVLTKLLER